MAAGDTAERTVTIALWKTVWEHIGELRKENRQLRVRLGLKPRTYKLAASPSRMPNPLPSFARTRTDADPTRCASCDRPLPPPARRGRPRLYCDKSCANRAAYQRAHDVA